MEHHPISAALVLSLMAAQAPAQIIYTDVIPDTLFNVSGDTCHLDLNNDGITDFNLRYVVLPNNCGESGLCLGPWVYPHFVRIAPMAPNAVKNTVGWPASLVPMELIGPMPGIWSTSAQQTLAGQGLHCVSGQCAIGGSIGQWNNVSLTSSRYLGLSFDLGGNRYYGWARLSIPSGGASFTLKDYAYNSVPNEIIMAGDTLGSISTGVGALTHPGVQVTPNPFTSTLSISIAAAEPGDVLCAVRALTGEVLVMWTVARSNGRSSFSRDFSSLAPGAYLLEVMIDGDRIVRKVMKE